MDVAHASGLEGVVVAETALSDVDGARGRLIIAGVPVEDLVQRAAFEEVCCLMWDGVWPSAARRAAMQSQLAEARVEAFAMLPAIGNALETTDGMEALRAAVGHIRAADPAGDRVRLTGAVPVFAAAWARLQAKSSPVAPQPALSHAADTLHMLSGGEPHPGCTRGLDAYFCCVVDHGMNASTFVARVVASTCSDLVSAVVGAIGALKGPLHGGAPGPVLDMLDAIGRPEAAAEWLEQELLAGRRIMGMGHRIYRTRDPRAAVLERAVERLEREGHRTPRLELARAVESAAENVLRARHPDRPLRANVEFYTAVLLDALGLPREAFSPLFACGRVVGWLAHVDEQRRTGRLIRPESRYVGPRPD